MKKVFLLSFISFCLGFGGLVLWAGSAHADPPFPVPPKGGLPACQADLHMCIEELEACEEDCQIFPGDGYPNPDAFGLSGHGPALSYTDNGDGTFTDNNTGDTWEIKNNVAGSVHNVDNTYTWSINILDPNGTLFTVFLAQLNDVAGGGANCFAGYCDWCIPNVKRLQSIVDYSTFNPSSSVPGLTAASNYWSATTFANNSFIAWFVNFSTGFVSVDGKSIFFRARAVRPCP